MKSREKWKRKRRGEFEEDKTAFIAIGGRGDEYRWKSKHPPIETY